MKDRIQKLKLNKRLLFGTRLFLEFKSINGVIQLFYLSRGLDLGQVVYLSLVWTITSFICDIPSSMLADKYGRKKMILVGIFLSSLSLFFLFFAQGFLMMALSYVIGAAGYSFYIGTDNAILYDSLKESGDVEGANRISGKYFSAQSLPKIIIPFLGSVIARDLLAWQFLLLVGIDFVGSILAFVLASFLTEPKIETVQINRENLLKEGFKLIKSDKVLLKFALNKIIMFQASFVYWRIYQVFLKDAGMPIIYLGLIYTVFQGLQFLILWNTEKVQKILGKVNFANLPAIYGPIAIIISLFSSNLVLLFISCVAILLTGVVRDPFFLSQMQARIPSFNRATATSTLNAIKNISDVPLLLLTGYLAMINVNYVLMVSGILFLIALTFLRIEKKELVI